MYEERGKHLSTAVILIVCFMFFALQIIAKCKIVTNLIDCWKYNNDQVK